MGGVGSSTFLYEFINSQGSPLGIGLNGFFIITSPSQGGGIVMQDNNGVLWLLTIGIDGRLSTQAVTF